MNNLLKGLKWAKARYSMVSHDHPWTFQKEWSKEDITNSYKE